MTQTPLKIGDRIRFQPDRYGEVKTFTVEEWEKAAQLSVPFANHPRGWFTVGEALKARSSEAYRLAAERGIKT